MHLGLALPFDDIGGDGPIVREFAELAEAEGYDGLTLPDHVLGGNPANPASGRAGGLGLFHDPFVAFGFIAACTKKVELSTQVLIESPAVSTSSGVTHASLVNTTASFGDMDTTVRLRTVQQLRTPTPNPWEVAWVLWHYTDDTHFYYLALKPNGWELGKEDPAYPGAQRYLVTSSSPTYAVGTWHTVRVRQIANVMTVWADGTQLASFTDNERPYTSGTLGLYNEDSLVHFDDVKVTTP